MHLQIPPPIASRVCEQLAPFVPDLTEDRLLSALASLDGPAAVPDMLTFDEVCSSTRSSRAKVARLLRRGTLPKVKLGRAVLIPKAAVMRLLTCGDESGRAGK